MSMMLLMLLLTGLFAPSLPEIVVWMILPYYAGGGGPKSRLLEAVIDECDLQGRVTLEGPVPHERACEFLVSGGWLL
jgi:hypothetical protein